MTNPVSSRSMKTKDASRNNRARDAISSSTARVLKSAMFARALTLSRRLPSATELIQVIRRIIVILPCVAIAGCGSTDGTATDKSTTTKYNCAHPSAAEPCEGKALEEWHREQGETPLRIQEGKEPESETEQKNKRANEKEAEQEKEALREERRIQERG
jgi:hypothetical protein